MIYAIETWGTGEPVLLVHGSLGVGAAAFEQQRPLANDYSLRVVTRRGYGETPEIRAVDVEQDARDVIEAMQGGAHLVGTSMGGVVALNAAGMRPDLVRSLTVIEPPAFALTLDDPAVRHIADGMKSHWASANPTDRVGFAQGFLKVLGIAMTFPDPVPPGVARAMQNLTTERPWRVDVPVGAVRGGAFPKLVVAGGWSHAFDVIAHRVATLVDAEFHLFPGAGHAVQRIGAPFNDLLRNFLRRAAAPARAAARS
jgi:pimeloyl-ACP methyl ester carboxylesterase